MAQGGGQGLSGLGAPTPNTLHTRGSPIARGSPIGRPLAPSAHSRPPQGRIGRLRRPSLIACTLDTSQEGRSLRGPRMGAQGAQGEAANRPTPKRGPTLHTRRSAPNPLHTRGPPRPQ